VLTDDGFQLPTPSAERAYKSAEKLLDWSLEAEHRAAVTTFANVLIGSLKGCFQAYRTVRVDREHMWERYYKLRSSESFKARLADGQSSCKKVLALRHAQFFTNLLLMQSWRNL